MAAPDFEQPAHFAFDAEAEAEIAREVAKYPPGRQASAVLAALYAAQNQMKRLTGSAWVPVKAMDAVAERLDMPPIRVYEVTTFYFHVQHGANRQVPPATLHDHAVLAARLRRGGSGLP